MNFDYRRLFSPFFYWSVQLRTACGFVCVMAMAFPASVRVHGADAPVPADTVPPAFASELSKAASSYRMGQLTDALTAAQNAGRLDPTRYEAPALAAVIFQAAGRLDEARLSIANALKLAPPDRMAKLQDLERSINGPTAGTKTEPSPEATPSANSADPISADQRRRFNVLMLVIEDADKATDVATRHKFLGEFLDKSAAFVVAFPDESRVWVLRALSSLELERADDGIVAARAIERLGLTNSDDAKIGRLVASLDRKGWMGAKTAAERLEALPKIITIPDLNIELQWIEAGSFTMGSPGTEANRGSDETSHRVTLSRGYWLGKTEVTQGQWEAVMGSNPSAFKQVGKSAPVEQVSWEDAMEFCRVLTTREKGAGRMPEGYEYTLPTEAQWEYGCRAGTSGAYAGDLGSMGWYDANSGKTTHPVSEKRANGWGLYDMHGNVWEWCRDWYGDYSTGAVTDPTGPPSGSIRVYRGGSCLNSASYCRSANRVRYEPGIRYNYLGFRLALSSVP